MAALRHATIALCRTSLLWACLPCAAGEAPPARPPERQALAAPAASGAIRVDGMLDEPAWRDAPVASAFVLMSPREGQAPETGKAPRSGGPGKEEIDELRRQMEEMQHRLQRLSEKDKT